MSTSMNILDFCFSSILIPFILFISELPNIYLILWEFESILIWAGARVRDPAPPALEVGELQAEGAHQIVVHQGRGGGLQVGGHQHGKGAAFATQHKFVLIVAIEIGCSEVIILIWFWFAHFDNSHRWFSGY